MARFPLPASHPVTKRLEERLHERLGDHTGSFTHVFQPAQPTPPVPYDAVLLPGTLSLMPDPAAALQALIPPLRADGLVLGWVLGEGSFPELREACATAGFPPPPALPAVQDVGGLLQRLGLALPVVDRDLITLTFPNWARLAAHLKEAGVLMRPPGAGLVTPRRWAALGGAYTEAASRPDGRVTLTLEAIFFTATKPGAATPQAARRGSGKISLVKILNPV